MTLRHLLLLPRLGQRFEPQNGKNFLKTFLQVKLDQDHLETVVPGEGREVVVLWGEHGGEVATLRSIDTEKFSASLKLVTGQNAGDKIKLPYEQFSKKWEAK